MVFVSYRPKSSPKPLFDPQIRISIQFWIFVENVSLICREIKKLQKNFIFDGTSDLNSVLKLEMTSYSDNADDITNFFVVLKSSWPILYSYQVSLLSDTKW